MRLGRKATVQIRDVMLEQSEKAAHRREKRGVRIIPDGMFLHVSEALYDLRYCPFRAGRRHCFDQHADDTLYRLSARMDGIPALSVFALVPLQRFDARS